jgi:uncharacterized membrane protein YuzA (DUF378 family)
VIRKKKYTNIAKAEGAFMIKLDAVAMFLVLYGAIAWGFVGLFDIDIIDGFLENEFWDRFAYVVIGAAALFKIIYFCTGNWKTSFREPD